MDIRYLRPCGKCEERTVCRDMKEEFDKALERLRWLSEKRHQPLPHADICIECYDFAPTGRTT